MEALFITTFLGLTETRDGNEEAQKDTPIEEPKDLEETKEKQSDFSIPIQV